MKEPTRRRTTDLFVRLRGAICGGGYSQQRILPHLERSVPAPGPGEQTARTDQAADAGWCTGRVFHAAIAGLRAMTRTVSTYDEEIR